MLPLPTLRNDFDDSITLPELKMMEQTAASAALDPALSLSPDLLVSSQSDVSEGKRTETRIELGNAQ